MLLNWKVVIALFLLAVLIASTPYFGRFETRQFSAYAECRKIAMSLNGYAVWKHEQTTQKIFRSRIFFSDGYNSLECRAIGVGPFWIVRGAILHLFDCSKDLGNGEVMMFPTEYFGVSP